MISLESCPMDEASLNERLSRPTDASVQSLAQTEGDIAVLGVGGKMGPTLAVMARRALDARNDKRRVIGVARFSDAEARNYLEANGVETISCDLLDQDTVNQLPITPNVIYMAGQKFGTTGSPERTWAMNALVPAHVAAHYIGARTVVFSTGCVYPNTPVQQGGSQEQDPLEPLGEYANSCVARERVFDYYSRRDGTPVLHFRLNYAIDLRYGVLLDIARKVKTATPIDLTMGHVNVIWQGDANAWALQSLLLAASPPTAFNVTGPETLSVRALALEFGRLMNCTPQFTGHEAETALLSNAARAFAHFGYPTVSLEQMTRWVAEWVQKQGKTLDKPTQFEVRDGNY
ncbi:MAG: dependent epimerase/dehydratase family protein [Chthonomonadaceae bacterium]|nr:dependent epimerase/dehydratase family protein [Chthonomonadaceae bacterium]